MPAPLLRAFVRPHVLAYRLSGGRLGGRWGKARVLLLTTRGRRSSKARTVPLLYLEDRGRFVVVATNDGATRHPAWYLNLRAQPRATVQAGPRSFPVEGKTASAAEREHVWPWLVAMYPNYERDQRRTARELPVVILERASSVGATTG